MERGKGYALWCIVFRIVMKLPESIVFTQIVVFKCEKKVIDSQDVLCCMLKLSTNEIWVEHFQYITVGGCVKLYAPTIIMIII